LDSFSLNFPKDPFPLFPPNPSLPHILYILILLPTYPPSLPPNPPPAFGTISPCWSLPPRPPYPIPSFPLLSPPLTTLPPLAPHQTRPVPYLPPYHPIFLHLGPDRLWLLESNTDCFQFFLKLTRRKDLRSSLFSSPKRSPLVIPLLDLDSLSPAFDGRYPRFDISFSFFCRSGSPEFLLPFSEFQRPPITLLRSRLDSLQR